MWAARCLFDIYKSVTFLCTAQCIQIASVTLRRAPHFSQRWIWASLAFRFDFTKNTSWDLLPQEDALGTPLGSTQLTRTLHHLRGLGVKPLSQVQYQTPHIFIRCHNKHCVCPFCSTNRHSLISLGAGPITQTKRRPVGFQQLPMETYLPRIKLH